MLRKECILFLLILAPLCTLHLIPIPYPAVAGEVSLAKEEFFDLSEKEHCISNLMLSYAKKDIERFSELLHENYHYYGFDNEIEMNAQQECESTAILFKHNRISSIEIEPGSWTQIDDISGSPCTNCWESTRKYTITGKLSDEGGTVSGSGFTKYIITQVEENGKLKYKILVIIDLGKELPE